MATIHTAAIIRRERLEKFPAMAYRAIPALDLKRLLGAVRGGRRLAPVDWLRANFDHGMARDGFVFDLETRADGGIEWIGLQGLKGGAVFIERWSEAKWLARELFALGVVKVGHNIQGFDIPRLAAHGVEVREPFEDTMSLGGLCEPDMARGLYFQSALYLGHERPYWKELAGARTADEERAQRGLRAAWSETGVVGRPMFEEEWENAYLALDVDSTRRVWMAQRERARKEGWV